MGNWLAIAQGEVGQQEVHGPKNNSRIVEYASCTSLGATDDETPWCSSFVNWCMIHSGISGTGSAAARSWLKWGVPLDEPKVGCVVVFRRGTSPQSGHVGFVLADNGQTLKVLGGNQRNRVCVMDYRKSEVLGYRWPTSG
ncbi:TIGR02594 family protein [Azospirillum sp. 11R-A]|uniref:TIGR02594 family protein n=1 Tax=Azospirillum sp. 11R-A TaxID=3111634 RepID=UPI003C244012